MKLTGRDQQQLSEALRDAFTKPRLGELLKFRLEKNLDEISLGGDLREIVFELIQAAEAEGWTSELIAAARASYPRNALLVAFAQQVGLAPTMTPSGGQLERLIRSTNSFLDVSKWRSRLGEIESRVCRIEIASKQGTQYGTGFLVGPDLVMTNYHVVEALLADDAGSSSGREPQAQPGNVILRFDLKRLADGKTLHPGTEFRLTASNWLVDRSPPSPSDYSPEPNVEDPLPEHLDYALLRVEGKPGAKPVGAAAPIPGDPQRGWIEVSDKPYDFAPKSPLFIVQHPQGEPLKLALDTEAVIGVNKNATRVKYRTNTEPGSSGSPCFNADWELVALHHSGDPNFDPAHKPTHNEGIPFAAILALLEQRGLRADLAPPLPSG